MSGQDNNWYIAECKPTKERTLRSSLEKAGYNVYVASQTETKVYASRNRRKVEKVVIPGKIFINTTESGIWNYYCPLNADIFLQQSNLL